MYDLSDEQRMLEDTVASILRDAPVDSHGDIAGTAWPRLVEIGLCALPFAEADGGLNASPTDLSVVMRQLGRVVGETPFLSSVVAASTLIKELANDAQKAMLLPDLISGETIAALAHTEPGARYDQRFAKTRAIRENNGYRLAGLKSTVPHGGSIGWFIVSARIPESSHLGLFLIHRDTQGVSVASYDTHDGSHDADLALEGVLVPPEHLLSADALDALLRINDLSIAMACAEATAAMEEILALTVDHLKVRKQFGVAIGSFQALQHKAVDMFIEVEQAKSMAGYAVSMLGADPAIRHLALLAAKAHLNTCAKFVGETAVQLHGAIGMTIESKTGRLFQRLSRFQVRFGDRNYCTRELIATERSLLEI